MEANSIQMIMGEGVEGRLKGTYYVFLCLTVQGNMFRNKKVNKELKDLCDFKNPEQEILEQCILKIWLTQFSWGMVTLIFSGLNYSVTVVWDSLKKLTFEELSIKNSTLIWSKSSNRRISKSRINKKVEWFDFLGCLGCVRSANMRQNTLEKCT